MAMNFEQARKNMVENQVRPWEVLDARVLDVLGKVQRERFVEAAHRQLAYADVCLPIGHGEVMMKPVVEGRVLQALELLPTDRVLEIGTGSGFLTACLSRLCRHVTSVELHADLVEQAHRRLLDAGFDNVQLVIAEAVQAWAPSESFDALVATGAVAEIPSRWLGWLKPGGRALIIHGQSPVQDVTLLTTHASSQIQRENLFETDLPYLQHAVPPGRFVL